MQGIIVKGIAGFYYVFVPQVGILECKAKGIFRKNKVKPLVGDRVSVTLLAEEGKGNLEEVLERKNTLIRPAVANIDQALVVFSLKSPEPNFNLLDRFLIMMEQKKIPCILGFNKTDLASEQEKRAVEKIYQPSGYEMFFLSAKEREGIEALSKRLNGQTTAIAGPSGVGKSSLINRLQKGVSMETGEVSEKIQRGKHTTRHAQLILIGEDSFIFDTPGFSSLEIFALRKEELAEYYPEFLRLRDGCRFSPCSHLHEPDCAVKYALDTGKVSSVRYENYGKLYQQLKEKKQY